MAEWWINECGGLICSNCGCFYDDYYNPNPPDKCKMCGSTMIINNNMLVDKEYRLSTMNSKSYLDESKYPFWLLMLRNERERKKHVLYTFKGIPICTEYDLEHLNDGELTIFRKRIEYYLLMGLVPPTKIIDEYCDAIRRAISRKEIKNGN